MMSIVTHNINYWSIEFPSQKKPSRQRQQGDADPIKTTFTYDGGTLLIRSEFYTLTIILCDGINPRRSGDCGQGICRKASSTVHMLTLKVLVLVVAVVVAVGKAIQMAAASNRFEYPHICMGVGDTLVIGCIWHSSWNWFIWTEQFFLSASVQKQYCRYPEEEDDDMDTPSADRLPLPFHCFTGRRNHALSRYSESSCTGHVFQSRYWCFSFQLYVDSRFKAIDDQTIRLPEWILPHEYSSDGAILILDTNFSSLQLLQVNLTPLLPPDEWHHIDRFGTSPDFYLAPPRRSWKVPPTESFVQEFVVPTIEIRRRLSANARNYFLRYQWVVDDKPVRPISIYRQYLGRVIRDDDDDNASLLDKPLRYFQGALHRFRPLDLTQAVCRH